MMVVGSCGDGHGGYHIGGHGSGRGRGRCAISSRWGHFDNGAVVNDRVNGREIQRNPGFGRDNGRVILIWVLVVAMVV